MSPVSSFGIENGGSSSLILATLVIARLGEADHHAWWRSHGASPTGSFVLESRFPRTSRVLGLEIALVAAERRHREEFADHGEFVHLFSAELLGARLARAWLAERKTEGVEADLVTHLHSASTSDLEELIPATDPPTPGIVFGDRVRIGEIPRDGLLEPEDRARTGHRLARAYVDSPSALPYLEVVTTT